MFDHDNFPLFKPIYLEFLQRVLHRLFLTISINLENIKPNILNILRPKSCWKELQTTPGTINCMKLVWTRSCSWWRQWPDIPWLGFRIGQGGISAFPLFALSFSLPLVSLSLRQPNFRPGDRKIGKSVPRESVIHTLSSMDGCICAWAVGRRCNQLLIS